MEVDDYSNTLIRERVKSMGNLGRVYLQGAHSYLRRKEKGAEDI